MKNGHINMQDKPPQSRGSQLFLCEYINIKHPNSEGNSRRYDFKHFKSNIFNIIDLLEASENLDFRYSSRQACNLIKKMKPDKTTHTNTIPPIRADEIASEIQGRSKRQPNYAFEWAIRHEEHKYYTPWPESSELSDAIGEPKMTATIKYIRNGNAAGVVGVYSDMMTHLGPAAMRWLASALANAIKNFARRGVTRKS